MAWASASSIRRGEGRVRLCATHRVLRRDASQHRRHHAGHPAREGAGDDGRARRDARGTGGLAGGRGVVARHADADVARFRDRQPHRAVDAGRLAVGEAPCGAVAAVLSQRLPAERAGAGDRRDVLPLRAASEVRASAQRHRAEQREVLQIAEVFGGHHRALHRGQVHHGARGAGRERRDPLRRLPLGRRAGGEHYPGLGPDEPGLRHAVGGAPLGGGLLLHRGRLRRVVRGHGRQHLGLQDPLPRRRHGRLGASQRQLGRPRDVEADNEGALLVAGSGALLPRPGLGLRGVDGRRARIQRRVGAPVFSAARAPAELGLGGAAALLALRLLHRSGGF
mmetsp:Transcript_14571/g.39931  ORF Transcript_14571/g.39931 Transcript_14571/m.39931 type:complete len:337 (+) Transcript_14571:327-1337(+)